MKSVERRGNEDWRKIALHNETYLLPGVLHSKLVDTQWKRKSKFWLKSIRKHSTCIAFNWNSSQVTYTWACVSTHEQSIVLPFVLWLLVRVCIIYGKIHPCRCSFFFVFLLFCHCLSLTFLYWSIHMHSSNEVLALFFFFQVLIIQEKASEKDVA